MHAVEGCFYQMYTQKLGGPSGALGFPTSDQLALNNGWKIEFQNSFMTFDNATAQVSVFVNAPCC